MIETFVINPPTRKRKVITLSKTGGVFSFLRNRRKKRSKTMSRRSRRGFATRLRASRRFHFKDNPVGLALSDNTWFGHPRLHRKAARKGWIRHRKSLLRGIRKGGLKRKLGRIRKLHTGRAGKWRALVSKFARMPKYRKHRGMAFKAAAKVWRGAKAKGLVNNPYMVATNPRHRKVSRKRHYRKNAYMTLTPNKRRSKRGRRHSGVAKFLRNPSGAMAVATTPFKTLINKQFLMGTVLPITGGFVGSTILGELLGKKVVPMVAKSFVYGSATWHKPVMTLSAGVLGSIAIGLAFKKSDLAAKVLAGSAIAVLASVLEPQVRKIPGLTGIGFGVGTTMTENLKSRIAQSIREEVAKAKGVSAFMTQAQSSGAGMSAYVSQQTLPRGQMSGVTLDDMFGESEW